MMGLRARPRPWIECSTNRKTIGAGLFLKNSPSMRSFPKVVEQLRPKYAGLDFNDAARNIKVKNPIHGAHVNQSGFRAELLAAHGVTATGDIGAENL